MKMKPTAAPKAMRTERIHLDGIEVTERMRQLSDERVEALKTSISTIGLRTPITVLSKADGDDTRMILVAGNHRLAALLQLGEEATECFVIDEDEIDAQLWEIDENLARSELSPSERASHVARRKEIYETRYPETKQGSPGVSRQVGDTRERVEADRFTADTAKATGQSERAVQRDAERGTKIIPEAMQMIRGTKLDTGTYLDKIKRLQPDEQVAAVERGLADTTRIEKERADRKARQEENERQRQEHADRLPDHIKDRERAKADAIAARKADPVDADALVAEIEELREANAALETEVAQLKADNAKWEAMRVQFEQGGFEKVIAGKNEEIRVLKTRVESESQEKVRNLRDLRRAMKKLEELGQSRDVIIDIEPEPANG